MNKSWTAADILVNLTKPRTPDQIRQDAIIQWHLDQIDGTNLATQIDPTFDPSLHVQNYFTFEASELK